MCVSVVEMCQQLLFLQYIFIHSFTPCHILVSVVVVVLADPID